jgi:transcription factor MYB, plant
MSDETAVTPPPPQPPLDPPAAAEAEATHPNPNSMNDESQPPTEPQPHPQPQPHLSSPPPSGEDDDGVAITSVFNGGESAAASVASMKERVKGAWSPEEDALLSNLVEKQGARNWTLIARDVPGRSGKSCRLRWCNQLDPQVKRKPFSGTSSPQRCILLIFRSFLRNESKPNLA